MAVLKTTLFILMHVSLSYKTGRKGITQAKRDYETKNKYNQRKCSKWPPFICKHNRASRKRFSLEFVTILGVIVAKASWT
jgi:hypothetical protein